jgi:hypothetical protein
MSTAAAASMPPWSAASSTSVLQAHGRQRMQQSKHGWKKGHETKGGLIKHNSE